MKILMIFSLFSLNLHAAQIKFLNPCTSKIELIDSKERNKALTVGELTINTLNELKIQFKGTESGISSIFNTPVGMDALEVISDKEMKAFGWCYSVNGVSPELYPNKVYIKNNDNVVWWFGYASYKNGQWITQCSPSTKTDNLSSFCR